MGQAPPQLFPSSASRSWSQFLHQSQEVEKAILLSKRHSLGETLRKGRWPQFSPSPRWLLWLPPWTVVGMQDRNWKEEEKRQKQKHNLQRSLP